MTAYAIILGRSPIPGDLLPGGHVAILSEEPDLDGFFGRRSGLEFRDSIAVLSPRVTRFVLLFRKPVEACTVAEQVLATGTGGINIDACRVKHSSKADFEKHKEHVDRIKAQGGQWGDSWKNSSDLSGASDVKEGGRWPPNVLMVHGPSCKRAGTKRVKQRPVAWDGGVMTRGSSSLGRMASHDQETPQTRGPSVEETVAAWECQEDCPVRLLDEQTGERPSTGNHPSLAKSESILRPGQGDYQRQGPLYSDSGGASRFFPQFKDDFELVAWVRKLISTPHQGP